MKKIIGTLAIVLFTLFVSTNASAQQYFTYDGDKFSVLLTYDDNDKLTKVEFSENNAWKTFKIKSFADLENAAEGGFVYTVLDGKNQEYKIDYYRTSDYIMVFQTSTGAKWRLNRREED